MRLIGLAVCGMCNGAGTVEEAFCSCGPGGRWCDHRPREVDCKDCGGTGRGGCEACAETRAEDSALCPTCKKGQDQDLKDILAATQAAMAGQDFVPWADEIATKLRERKAA